MIDGFEIDSTGRATCNHCKEPIEKGSVRGYQRGSFKGHRTTKYFCLTCAERLLEDMLRARTDVCTNAGVEEKTCGLCCTVYYGEECPIIGCMKDRSKKAKARA